MRKFLQYIIILPVVLLYLPVLRAQDSTLIPSKMDVFPKITYDWVSYQMKISLEKEEEKLAFQCFFVNRIDSIIYLNLNRSGIELARVVLTPDSVTYVNKLEHEYYAGDYSFLRRVFGFPLDFDMVQSLMNGVDFKDFDDSLHRVEEDGKLHYVAPQRTNRQGTVALMQSIEIGAGGVILDNDMTDLKTMRDIDIEYEDYTMIDGTPFFTKFEVEMEVDDVELEAELKNIRFNVPGPTTIRIPESFKEIEFK
ncbi:MAG: DUF4292 domain-containing protein [Bacteroidales bacterium]|nr:DUF4292 domain-containing protein [Bacteroidales bacterium]